MAAGTHPKYSYIWSVLRILVRWVPCFDGIRYGLLAKVVVLNLLGTAGIEGQEIVRD